MPYEHQDKNNSNNIALGNAGKHTVHYTNLAVMLTVSCADRSLETTAMLVTWLRHYIMCSAEDCLSFIGACYQPNNTHDFTFCPLVYDMAWKFIIIRCHCDASFYFPLKRVHATLSNHVTPVLHVMLLVDFIALYLKHPKYIPSRAFCPQYFL